MDKLPADFENRYHSDKLRQLIADDGMWYLIPAVSEKMNSRSGIRRLEENHPLFSFIDTYLSDFRLPQTENIIRRALKNSDDLIKKNGEGLIQYMRQIMANV